MTKNEISDDFLVELAQSDSAQGAMAPVEMMRRLKDTLHAEEKAIRRLTAWLVGLTVVLVILTGIIVWLTIVLVRRG